MGQEFLRGSYLRAEQFGQVGQSIAEQAGRLVKPAASDAAAVGIATGICVKHMNVSVNNRHRSNPRLASASGRFLRAVQCTVLALGLVGLGLGGWVAQTGTVDASAVKVVYDTPEDAYEAGRRAFKRGDYRTAIAPLRDAVKGGVFLARYYLAEILADTSRSTGDPREAYELYSALILDHPDVDPFYDYRAKFVARAYVMKGRYLSGELSAPGIQRSASQARRLFGYAATYLDYPDAQYEFARMLLKGQGGVRNVSSGKHYLSTLSRKGHAGAQGYLAELFWQGEVVPKRADYALALSTLAVRNTPRNDRIWLDALHTEIYCGVTDQVRNDATALLGRWAKAHPSQKIYPRERTTILANGDVRWSCANGNSVDGQATEGLVAADGSAGAGNWPDRNRLEALHGTMIFGLTRRDSKTATGDGQ